MRLKNKDKQDLVRQEAVHMLVNDGLEGFSMNRLAKACGISVNTLYIYYQDKDDLILQIGQQVGLHFFTVTLTDFSPHMPFAAGLRKQWENRVRFALDFPKELACYELIRFSAYGPQMLAGSATDFTTLMTEYIQRAIDRAELKSVSPEVFWSIAYGPLYSLLRFHANAKGVHGNPFALQEFEIEKMFQLVLKALTPD